MPNAMQTFSFSPTSGNVVTCYVRVTDRDGNPWFVLADVCNALGLSNPSVAARALDEDERMTLSSSEGHSGQRGGAQSFTIVSEAGLYALIMTSRKPQAREFKRWVTHTVLPTLRKEGAYVVGEEKLSAATTPEDIDALNDHIISLLRHKADLLEKRVEEQRAVIHEHLEMVTVDEYRALTHRYFPHSYKVRLGVQAAHMAKARGITLGKQTRMVRGRDGEMHDASLNVYPRALLEEAERALAEADRVLAAAA